MIRNWAVLTKEVEHCNKIQKFFYGHTSFDQGGGGGGGRRIGEGTIKQKTPFLLSLSIGLPPPPPQPAHLGYRQFRSLRFSSYCAAGRDFVYNGQQEGANSIYKKRRLFTYSFSMLNTHEEDYAEYCCSSEKRNFLKLSNSCPMKRNISEFRVFFVPRNRRYSDETAVCFVLFGIPRN